MKEPFVANVIRFALVYRQLFFHHHAAKVVKATIKYCTTMGIFSNSSSSEE
jgi:DNA-directed RNA polymerase subunit E'/Rpb7